MSTHQQFDFDDTRLNSLFSQLVEQRISDADFEALAQQLARDDAARMHYVKFMALHNDLSTELTEDDGDAVQIREELESLLQGGAPLPPSIMPTWPLNMYQLGTTIGGLVFILLFFTWITSSDNTSITHPADHNVGNQVASANDKQNDTTYMKSAALISQAYNVVWSGSTQYAPGTVVSPCTLEFESGLIQVEFLCGATMILEGPAKFDIISHSKGYIYKGSIRVSVPEQAIGFTVGSTAVDVEDLGTEFGMDISSDGNAEVHVIQGKVRLHQPSGLATNRTNIAPQELESGQGVRLSSNGDLDRISSDSQKFAGPDQLWKNIASSKLSGFERWQSMIDSLRKSKSTKALYVFNDDREFSNWGRTLLDLSDPPFHGAIVGCDWTSGRWKQKQGLLFSGSGDRVRVNVPGTSNALTLSAWIKLSGFGHHFPKSKIAIIHPDSSQKNSFHWTIDAKQDSAQLHLAVTDQYLGKEDRRHYPSLKHAFTTTTELNQWTHVAATYDPVLSQVTHYRNGEIFQTLPIERLQKISLGSAEIGNWPYRNWAEGTEFEVRNLNGAIDELLISSRCLSPAEIKLLFETGSNSN